MRSSTISLQRVDTPKQVAAAHALITEYLAFVGEVARTQHGLSFDLDAMVRSDLEDRGKFFPPTGRLYLAASGGRFVAVGALKRLEPGVGELQRLYVQPAARGLGVGRAVVLRLMNDARSLGYITLRLESLRALTAAHALYRSLGFVEVDAYADNSMRAYQAANAVDAYRNQAVFMEWHLPQR